MLSADKCGYVHEADDDDDLGGPMFEVGGWLAGKFLFSGKLKLLGHTRDRLDFVIFEVQVSILFAYMC